MPYLHLPVQSGNDRVLKAMNRSHSRESYLRIIERVRAARPDIAISGDFIVGFPGETETEFLDTLEIVRAVNYDQAGRQRVVAGKGVSVSVHPGGCGTIKK